MGKDRPRSLSEPQLALVRVLWEQGEATVAQVQQALQDERALALTTVATMLSRLEKRGVVKRREQGRTFVYRAAVEENDLRRSMVSDLMDRLFEGDAAALVNHLLSEGEIDAGEIARLKKLLSSREKGGRNA